MVVRQGPKAKTSPSRVVSRDNGQVWMERDPFDLVGNVLDGQYRVDAVGGLGELSVVYPRAPDGPPIRSSRSSA